MRASGDDSRWRGGGGLVRTQAVHLRERKPARSGLGGGRFRVQSDRYLALLIGWAVIESGQCSATGDGTGVVAE